MRVTFIRFPDHQRAHVVVARDDGVVYKLDSGPASAETPHDLVHFTVEDALGIADGIWGAIAGGVVFRSMHHESGRRPPHAAERSKDLIREHRELLQRAELIGGLCERAAHGGLAAREPFMPLTTEQLDTAVAALRRADAAWSKLRVGEELELRWPAWCRITAAATPAKTERPGRSRSRRGRSSA
ncbi:hypothetical protein ABT369_53290 [Dactylosporangium sp. NPDC000244]|uniref:hypothetical protein n=1 Tax=Dactylosporangium sp. NPDC000244 TaxID=3154365 RepID=UPI00332781B1